MKIDSILQARWIIPIEPEFTILEQHSLAIHEGKIIDLGPNKDIISKYTTDNLEILDRHALLPGFINAHTHTPMTLMRGIADDLPLMDWLQNHIWPLEQKWMSENFVRDGSDLAIAEMIRSGTTCFNDMYFFPDITAQQAIHHGIRASIGLILIDFPTVWADHAEHYIEKGLQLHDQLRHEALISTPFAPHAPYTVSDQPLSKIRTLANELDIPIHMHVHETEHEVCSAELENGSRPLQRLMDLDMIDPAFIAVHMTQMTDKEIENFALTGASIVHCPESNLKLASGFCPVAKCIDAGINIALGTDGTASNNDLDMLGELRSASLLAKAVAGNASVLPAPAALRMATINGAKALGLDSITGSLKPGKFADVIAIQLDTIETQPLYDPVSQIVYSCNRDQVTDVWVAGKQLLKQRQLTTLDEQELLEKVTAWQGKLMGFH